MKLVPARKPARKLSEQKDVVNFLGLNRGPKITQGELRSMTNLSTKYMGCLYPRNPRAVSFTLTSGTALFAANNGKMCWVDGTNFVYDGVVKGTVTAGSKSIAELEGVICIFPDKKYYNYKTNTYGTIGSGSPTDGEAPTTGQCPNMDYICVHNNRIWGIKNQTVYGSKFNDPMTWAQYSVPINEADSVYFKISSDSGSLIGIRPLSQYIVFTTNHALYQMYGSKPSNFDPRRITSSKGCIDNKSMVEIDGALFMLSSEGVSVFQGSAPEVISEKLQETYVSGKAITDGEKYWLSLYNGSSYSLYCYENGLWVMEDNLQVKDFALLDGYIYALASDNKVYKFNSGTETVQWEAVTDRFTESYMGNKATSKIKVEAELSSGSSVAVYISYDGGAYTLVDTYSDTGYRYFKTYQIPKDCFYFQVKFVGTGMAKIYSLTRDMLVRSDM
jgi:hypothetical protein